VAPEIFIPLRRAGAEFHASTEGQAAADRVLEVLDTPAASTQVDRASSASASPAALDVSGLVVEYAHRDRPALLSFSMHVPAGALVALTGPSGSGKSTVLAALLGFVTPRAGKVAVGELVTGGDPAWREHFSWLPQRPHLFNATLAQNLRLGAPEASDEELRAVLDAVGLAELLAGLPAGLDTAVGHDGLTLSAGERQRVALARALLRPAPVLLLDEPTASLDPPTVARLAPSIEPWLSGRSVVVAAHEPTLLPHFDAVVALSAAQPMAVS
jgi:ABC-type transport system involved in cytochrome bd biosynthesis fused ATPase/permease subunit